MKPTEYQLKQLRNEHERLKKFMEINFEANAYDALDLKTIGWMILFSLPLIGQLSLILVFLIEWHLKLMRMTLIVLTQIKMAITRFYFTKLLLVLVFIFMVLFILANIFK